MKKNILALILVFTCAVCLFGCLPVIDTELKIASTFNITYNNGASLKIDGNETHYDKIADAWKVANSTTDKTVDFILWEDWKATDGNFGLTNEKGFNALGGLVVETRGTVDSLGDTNKQLCVDLNSKTIDANRTEAVDGGNVITINCGNDSNFHGSVKFVSGTIKGGNNLNNGGGICIAGSKTKIYFESLTITNNNSESMGGGVYEKTSNCCFDLKNVTITGNKSEYYGGGFASETVASSIENCSTMNLNGKVLICDNTTKYNWTSYGLYIKMQTDFVSDEKNNLGNLRLVDLNMSNDSKITFSKNANKLRLTYERKYSTIGNSYSTLINEKNNEGIGFLVTRTETIENGCSKTDIDYGCLDFAY